MQKIQIPMKRDFILADSLKQHLNKTRQMLHFPFTCPYKMLHKKYIQYILSLSLNKCILYENKMDYITLHV